MKKSFLILSFILVLMLLTACGNSKSGKDIDNKDITNPPVGTEPSLDNITPTPSVTPVVTEPVGEEPESSSTVTDYYPFKENSNYVYEGEGNEYASYRVYTDYIEDNRAQLRVDNGGTELVKVLEVKDGELTMILSRGEIYYRENHTNISVNNTEVLLKEPLEKGTTWTLTDNKKRYISNVDVEITTPSGTYKTLEVTTEDINETEDTNASKTMDYYALGIGLVKTIYMSGDMEVTSSLSKIENNTPFVQSIRFYYPNVDEDGLYAVDKEVPFYTNDITPVKLVEAIKDIVQEKYEPLLSTNTTINSLYMNEDKVVCVDFSKELINEMNVGSSYELLMLQGITNTLANYYGTNEVYITVDGNSYESGHISMKKGETFHLDMDQVVD